MAPGTISHGSRRERIDGMPVEDHAAWPADGWRFGREAADDLLAETFAVAFQHRRPGVGITRPGDAFDWHIVLDPENYDYLGFRDTNVREDGVTVKQISAVVSHGVVDRIGQRP